MSGCSYKQDYGRLNCRTNFITFEDSFLGGARGLAIADHVHFARKITERLFQVSHTHLPDTVTSVSTFPSWLRR